MKTKTLLIIAAGAILSVACQKKEKGKVLSPDEQKSRLEEVGIQAVNEMDLDNWKPTCDFLVESFNILDDIKTDESVETWTKAMETKWEVDESTEIIDLSVINGKFTIANGTLHRDDSKDLTLDYALKNGTACNAAGSVKNSSTKVVVSSSSTHKNWLIVPSAIDFALASAGKDEVTINVTTDLTLAGDEPTPLDKYSVTSKVVAGDYTINLSRAYYSTSEIGTQFAFSHGKVDILEGEFLAKGKLALDKENGYDPIYEECSGEADVTIKVMGGDVTVTGSANYNKFLDVEKKYANEKNANESTMKEMVKELEGCFDLTLIIDKAKQAKLGLELLAGESGQPEITPVLRFQDGSSYQLPEEYFNEKSFQGLIDAVNALVNKIDKYFGSLNGDASAQ